MLLAEDRRQKVNISAAWNGTGTAPTGSVVNISAAAGSILAVQVSGTFTATLQFEGRIAETDDVNDWFAITGIPAAGGSTITSATAAGRWFFQYAGLRAARVRCSAYTSGTPVVTMNISAGAPAGGAAGAAGGAGGAVTQGTSPWVVAGGLTNDNAAPGATNGGVLASRAQVASPSYSEGNQVLLSSNLSGQLRTVVQGYQASGVVVAQNPLVLGTVHTDNTVRFLFNAPNSQNTAGVNLGAAADCRLAQAMGADPTAITAANYSVGVMNRHAIPFQIGGHPNVKTFAQQYTGAQTDVAVVTQAAGGKIVVTGFMILASMANTVNVSARLGFGTANVPAYNAAGILGSHPNIAPGSGFGRGNGSGIIGAGADDEDLRLTISVPTGGAVDCNVTYFVLPT